MLLKQCNCIVDLIDNENHVNGQKIIDRENNYKENFQNICVNSDEISKGW